MCEICLQRCKDLPELQESLPWLFLIFCTIIIRENLEMFMFIKLDRHLHPITNCFLGYLLPLDLCHSSSLTPMLLKMLLMKKINTSPSIYFPQLHWPYALAVSECYLLATVVSDRGLAIYTPLVHSATVFRSLCHGLMVGISICDFLTSVVQTFQFFIFDFNTNHIQIIDLQVDALTGLVVYTNEDRLLVILTAHFITSVLTVLIPYDLIFATLLKILSLKGRHKFCSTFSFHLSVAF
ncbi:putative olfactory receptor 8G2 [Ornithorhynchus anatinus]|uniref:putative olfactory receptor 8G2 n=1 Tax=Ornithorhynchus anatinus TaxID=9258 RepID=UPI0007AA7F47|nr:putative olfactory receptor 8G2 [Ornithorhynchus anatinus]